MDLVQAFCEAGRFIDAHTAAMITNYSTASAHRTSEYYKRAQASTFEHKRAHSDFTPIALQWRCSTRHPHQRSKTDMYRVPRRGNGRFLFTTSLDLYFLFVGIPVDGQDVYFVGTTLHPWPVRERPGRPKGAVRERWWIGGWWTERLHLGVGRNIRCLALEGLCALLRLERGCFLLLLLLLLFFPNFFFFLCSFLWRNMVHTTEGPGG